MLRQTRKYILPFFDESSPKQSASLSGLVPGIDAQRRDRTGWINKSKK